MDRRTVAVINSNPDAIEMLTTVLRVAGLPVVSTTIRALRDGDAEAFLREHDPAVIVFDVAPPYGLNWRFLERLRELSAGTSRQFVITSVNKRQAESLAQGEETIYEVVGKPYDMGEIARAVKEALFARPTREPAQVHKPSLSERRHEDRRRDDQFVTGRRHDDRRRVG